MKILLDTNFLMTCVKEKIDFISQAEKIDEKIEWLVPDAVLMELEDLSMRKGEKEIDKLSARTAIAILEKIQKEIVEIKNKNVDKGIIDFVRGKEIVLATLDKKIQASVENKILKIRKRQLSI